MNTKARHFMFVSAIILFLILTTGLSIFASGYRFNWQAVGGWRNLLIKTGSILIESEPKGATVSLEQIHGHYLPLEKKTADEKKTPFKLNNLRPGEYLITLDLKGYLPYQKKIRIEPAMTTVLSELVLFKNCLPMLVLPTTSDDFTYHPNGRYLALPQEEIIFNLNAEKNVAKINREAKVNWSNDNQASEGARIINLEQGVVTDYTALLGKTDSGQLSGNTLIYLQNGALNVLETNTKKIKTLEVGGEVLAYEVNDDILITLINQNEQSKLKFIDYKNNNSLKETKLLKADHWSLKKENQSLILRDNDHKITYLIDIRDQEIKHLLRDSDQTVFLNSNELAYARGSEIHLYNLNSKKDSLLTRLGAELSGLAAGPSGHLIYATTQELGILNLNDPKHETAILFSGTAIKHLNFEKNSNSIYFFAEIGVNKGLYKIEL
ncbi:MAG: PEGA domain-containing protein [Patescibacteria group bacterium]|nr:PEGA domain-containing protein [Patescibacteria group bacterium]